MLKFRLVTTIRDAVECGKVSFIEVHEPRGFGATDDEEDVQEKNFTWGTKFVLSIYDRFGSIFHSRF